MRDQNGIIPFCFFAGVFQAVRIILQIGKMKGVFLDFRQFNQRELSVIEHHFKSFDGIKPHMMAALITDAVILFQFAVINHAAAGRAFFPQVVRYFLRADQALKFRAYVTCQPVHKDTIAVITK